MSHQINLKVLQQKWLIILRAMIANDREKMLFLLSHLDFGIIRIKPDLSWIIPCFIKIQILMLVCKLCVVSFTDAFFGMEYSKLDKELHWNSVVSLQNS